MVDMKLRGDFIVVATTAVRLSAVVFVETVIRPLSIPSGPPFCIALYDVGGNRPSYLSFETEVLRDAAFEELLELLAPTHALGPYRR